MPYLTTIKYLNILVIGLIILLIAVSFFKPMSSEYPTGMIIPYYGLKAPYGWALCDGNNDTPDLRGRFIIGAGDSSKSQEFVPGSYGGSFEKPKLPIFIDYKPEHNRIWGVCKQSDSGAIHLYCEINNDLMTTITSKKIYNSYYYNNLKTWKIRNNYLTNKDPDTYFKNYSNYIL